MTKTVMSALAAAALALPLAVSVPASAADSTCAAAPLVPVTTVAVFNNPVAGEGAAIVQWLCSMIKQTPAGARIRVAHFVMSGAAGEGFATELIKARDRGVHVQVLVDGDTRGGTVAAQLAAALGTDITANSWLHVCTGPMSGGTAACIGNKGQHNKFYLFSRTGSASDVVVQSSANLTDLNSTTYWNNAVTFTDDRQLSRAYNSYFEDLAAERKNLDYNRTVHTGSVVATFFPQAEGDIIVDSLRRVSCRPGEKIRVGMSEWDTFRIAIADRLRELARSGCDVQIVAGILSPEVKQSLLTEPRVDLRLLADGSALPGRIHSKYLLVDGKVYTGSHNFNETSLRRNDETLLRVNDRGIYGQYVANFETLRAAAVPANA
ncbi:phospholipase D-like domain-containing protein [Nonomuraea turcica]|uniref:phospholipase D-like domain-containing protein n=1 Tax=Nonomuraea sp. G32 TaxID=3067274 RepID=UPI00273C5885|nr:phospholipase D-like domain-containing protein [Nonomuraea sp. G32]MDP4505399.1 phospholipase D-like domain-containing protein [Nonomuraea sp. G32]